MHPRDHFYASILAHLWGSPRVPEARDLAKWIQSQRWEDPPDDFPLMLDRLRKWDLGKPYPPLPDNDALAHGTDPPRQGWWTPGALPGRPARKL